MSEVFGPVCTIDDCHEALNMWIEVKRYVSKGVLKQLVYSVSAHEYVILVGGERKGSGCLSDVLDDYNEI
jgi:hypothetical protein